MALEGPKSRDHLADLLWGRASAGNLRVELHRLKTAFENVVELFTNGEDPLSLPDTFEICVPTHVDESELFLGLDDLSPTFQDWLELQRAHLAAQPQAPVRRELVKELAGGLEPPYLLILQGQPGSGRQRFAQDLARALKLPFVAGSLGPTRALRYFSEAGCDERVRDYLLKDKQSLWVIEQSAFGEDSAFLLDVRGAYPPDQTRFLALPNLSWQETRQFSGLSFGEAAKLYTATCGHLGYLTELLAVRPQGGFGETLPLPQRIRAMYQREARMLTPQARYALERLSVHPGALSDELIKRFEAETWLDELERYGWLRFEGAWTFVNDMVRQVLYGSLPGGQRQRYHQAAAETFELANQHAASDYHYGRIAETTWRESTTLSTTTCHTGACGDANTTPSQPDVSSQLLQRGLKEQALLELRRFGKGVEGEAGSVTLVRTPSQRGASGLELELPGPCLVRVRGEACITPTLPGESGESAALRLAFLGKQPKDVLLSHRPCLTPTQGAPLHLLLPERVDYWFYTTHSHLRLEGAAFAGVVALEFSAYSMAAATTLAALNVIDLTEDVAPRRPSVKAEAVYLGAGAV